MPCLQVPYHPMVLMTWGAHMNIQRVTSAAWSYYLLKYTLKVRPAANALPTIAACAGMTVCASAPCTSRPDLLSSGAVQAWTLHAQHG